MLVIPGVAGMCIWSPRLASDSATPSRANVSVRGEAFAQHFIKCFNVHLYENLANEHRATGLGAGRQDISLDPRGKPSRNGV